MGLLSATLVAQTAGAARYDNQIQTAVTQKLAAKNQFSNVKATVEDGVVTLTGTVDLYQRKLDAAKLARKTANAQGVRNLITVAGPTVPDDATGRETGYEADATCAWAMTTRSTTSRSA